jgi:hypothetical protein
MLRTVIFLEDLGPGEKGIAEMLGPVLIRRLTLCLIWGSSAFTVVTEACMGGPRTRHWVGGSDLGSPENRGQCAFQCFPQQMGQGPGGSFLRGHSLLKCPACPH